MGTTAVGGATVSGASDAELARIVRAESGRLVGALHRQIGNLDVAEESVADAIAEALDAWRRDGVPARPGGWLHTAARRNALDRLRRDARYRDKLVLLVREPPPGPVPSDDDRLALLFGCCHPALAPAAQLALTLRAVAGLTTAQIARATLTSEATVAQRIVRAKRKIGSAGIPVRIPPPAQLPERLDVVLTVVYLTYNEAFLTSGGAEVSRRDLADDAIWLAALVSRAFPAEAEPLGLLALLRLQHAREPARFAADRSLVLLPDQDRRRWDRAAIATGLADLHRAALLRRPGRLQLQAAIAACHAEAPSWADTDWLQVLTLYDVLLRHDPSPVVRLNRLVALARLRGPAPALTELEALGVPLRAYHLFHATRAALLRDAGRPDEALAADREALRLSTNLAEQRLLAARAGPELSPKQR